MHYPPLDRCRNRLRLGDHTELTQDMLYVILHRVLGNVQRVGDLLVRQSLHDQLEHLNLSRAQGR